MYPRSVRTLQADALFVSALQRSEEVNAGRIRQAIAVSLDAYGGASCASRVAQEFGDHPEAAADRMRWARAVADELSASPSAPTQQRLRRRPRPPVASVPRWPLAG